MSPVLDSIGSVKGYGWGSFSLPTAFESIATFVSDGSQSEVIFSSIPSTYQHLQIRGLFKDTFATDGSPTFGYTYMRLNNSSASQYAFHNLYGNGSVIASSGVSDNAMRWYGTLLPSNATFTNFFACCIIDVHDYASTTKNKTISYFGGNEANQSSANRTIHLHSGLRNNTSAITSITIYAAANTFATGSTFALYGIKGA